MGSGRWLGVLLGACTASCEDAGASATLHLLEFRQQDFPSVALNKELLFYFSEDLDPASVTSESVRVLDERGREAAGQRLVRGNALSFLPDLPLSSDLSDGGFRPGSAYHVILGGFPCVDGLRSARGGLLSAGLRLEFRTADVGTSPLFLDPFMGPFLFWPRGRSNPVVLEDGQLALEYGEALDPSTVPRARFELSRYPSGSSELTPVRTVTRLVENRRNHAVLLLEPVDANGAIHALEPDVRYYLQMPGRELRTLGGRWVEPGWVGVLTLVVPRTRIEIDFELTPERSSELPGGCDGTATWDRNVGLSMRYPAAAGSGVAGEVELRGKPPTNDLAASRLTVPSGATVDLSGFDGPVVLRSQAALRVEGKLVRRGPVRPGDDPITRSLESAQRLPPDYWEPLGDWVERLLGAGTSSKPWTVLIAGGDLLVPAGGAIDVEGPLVLVAGGRIRVEGSAFSHGDLWKTEGDGASRSIHSLPLRIDPPAVNLLRVPLELGAYAVEIPWSASRTGWRSILVGHEGSGELSAQFLQVSADGEARIHESPVDLESGLVRPLARLRMDIGRGEAWDPPHLESLRIEADPGSPTAH